MKFQKLTVLVFLCCAALVLGNAQAPPDDDDFDFEGSGSVVKWAPASSTVAPTSAGRPASTTTWDEPGLDGSGSGHHSDDSLGDDDDDDYYDGDYDYADYKDLDYPEEDDTSGLSGSSGGSWDGSKHDASEPRITPDSEETDTSRTVGVVHAIPPAVEEGTHHSEHQPTLGAHHPDTKVVSTSDADDYDGDDYDDYDENDVVIPPEVQEEMDEVQDELERVEEKQRELERELERQREANRAGGMDGLGTKAVDRDTSFFAQPGILAAVVGGAVVGLLCAILLVMLIVYRMRKKDEGSYPVDEPKRSLTGGNSYSKNKEFYA